MNSIKYSYIYDGNNNLIEELYQIWDGSAWENEIKYSYTYDVNNNKTEYLWQSWDGSAWRNFIKTSYTYIPVTSINEDFSSLTSYSLSNNYPNPFNPSTKINYRIGNESLVQLKVYDVLGNEVARLVDEYKVSGSYEIEFNASQLSSGIYFYKLRAGGFVETKKMILLR
ncbi:MAG: T9SS type A sorting domain-containing protein [Ignavibacteriales bacterium]|nr:T9SS type A sorting domain-containing protein [Ignavibacteriales bacterium]